MMEESYRIKCPVHIVMGDPLCLEQRDRFGHVLIDYQPETYFDARLI